MSTRCEFHGDALAELAAGRLAPAREGPLREHLSACAECRADLEALRAVASAAAAPPAGLEARIRVAVREAAAGGSGASELGSGEERIVRGAGRPRPAAWRPWALPLAAAAALAAIWVGVVDRGPSAAEPDEEATLAADTYAPYGTWPADGPEVAGEPVLTGLSADDLELLLEEMQL